jgi:hypothetical protein
MMTCSLEVAAVEITIFALATPAAFSTSTWLASP